MHDLSNGEAIGGHGLQNASYQQLTRVGHIVRHSVLTVEYCSLQLGHSVGAERHRAGHNKVEQHTERPYVHVDAYVVVVLEELGRGVGRTATVGVQLAVHTRLNAKPEVTHLDNERIGVGKEDILGLDIAVYDVVRVHVIDGADDLTEDDLGVALARLALVRDLRVEFAVRRVLHADEQALLCVYHLVQADYVRVTDLLHARDLAQKQPLCLVVQLCLVQDFDSDFFCKKLQNS